MATREQAEKVAVAGVTREDGWLYFIDQAGNIARSRMQKNSQEAVPGSLEIVTSTSVARDNEYIYFMDDDGDVARVPRSKRPKAASKGAVDRDSVASARSTIVALLPEPSTREPAMRLFAEGFRNAMQEAPDRCFVTLYSERIRLNVGSVEVATFDQGHLHFVLSELPTRLAAAPGVLVSQRPYTRLEKELPRHVGVDFDVGLAPELLPELHQAFLHAVVAATTTAINPASRSAHSPGLAELLRSPDVARTTPPTGVVHVFSHEPRALEVWLNSNTVSGFFVVIGTGKLHRVGLCNHYGSSARPVWASTDVDAIQARFADADENLDECAHCAARGLHEERKARAWVTANPKTYVVGGAERADAFLFLWKPGKDGHSFANYGDLCARVGRGESHEISWDCVSKQPRPGDVAFLQRTGAANNGFFARGVVLSDPRVNDDGRIDIVVTGLLPLGSEITREEAYTAARVEFTQTPQGSGNRVPVDVVDALDRLWKRGTRNAGQALPTAAPASPPITPRLPERRTVTTDVFVRDESVKAAVRKRAAGKCECCLAPAPFVDDEGLPFLEVHHLTWLVNGGTDDEGNAAAVCPNCHRRLHLAPSREVLTTQVRSRVTALNRLRS